MRAVYTPALGRDVYLRSGTVDDVVWGDTFTAQYHLPPVSMPPPRSVLDLGANIGLTAAHYAALWPTARVVAVEMDAGNAAVARRNIFVGDLVERAVVPWGPDAPNGQGVVHYGGDREDGYAIREHGTVAESATIFYLVTDMFGREVDFCKMDIEGTEWALFQDETWRPVVKHLLVELHGPEGWEPSDLLIARATVDLDRLGYDAVPHPPHPQAVFATRRS